MPTKRVSVNDLLKRNRNNTNNLDLYANGNDYINHYRYYSHLFDDIPNRLQIEDIDLGKARAFIVNDYSNEINFENFSQTFDFKLKKTLFDDQYIVLNNNLVINLYNDSVYLLFANELTNFATDFLSKLLIFKIKPKTAKTTNISLIIKGYSGLETKDIKIKKPKLDIDLHYNDDFKAINANILNSIKKSKTQGLYLFHGLPGTGKSTYIKHLIQQQTKTVIFMPPNMAGNLDSMELTEFLIDNPNCVLVIEDAEDLIVSRDDQFNSRLSFLLNITDGILSDSLGIQIIATFNTELKNIDKALLRKGRLTSIYEFKELELAKTNALLANLNHNFVSDKKMSLADIFNFETNTNYNPKSKKSVGF